ncbi:MULTISPECIES: hypothetical protein [Nostoc]|uniref:TonB C-terminal domain-containing protein n=1 Tax=Nostoc paludosum FACHB-159 TaxID=2692908 RepID=A0ABR8KDE5_9NOSO|nr:MULTISPECIES: hypothetical protein [Nostoc]MBD2679879.1 hypothetical protein [Nostoc sp. FACHB-857]MBD2736132.1 hypothetical protein [Nostoc paludosum FACHB-159]
MEPSVADKTPIPAKVWRRHTDPPLLWISVATSSVFLHLLVFLLLRSSNTFNLWFPQESQSAIPIELIDIAPARKSTSKSQSAAKIVSLKRFSSTQKSVAARTTPKNRDSAAINSTNKLQPKSKTDTSQTNSQPSGQQKVAKPMPTPTATPTPKVLVGNLPWNRRQDLKFGKGTALPSSLPTSLPTPPRGSTPTPTPQASPTPPRGSTPTPTPQASPTPPRESTPTPTPQTPPTPAGLTPPTPTPQVPPTSTQGASVAIVAPLLRDEVSNLIKSGEFIQDTLPDAIAIYQGSNTKQFDPSFLSQNSGLQPAQLLASLVIDRNGNFQQAVVLEIQPATLKSQKSTYEQALNQIFKTENFLPAQNNDGTKPDLSNLYVRIKIQSANSN